MKKRSPVAVLLLSLVTFGIYSIYWQVSTKGELNKLGAKIPTAWLLIVPLVNLWWLWKYSEGAEQVTKEKLSGVMAFVLLILLGFIGEAVIQTYYNKLDEIPAAAGPTPVVDPSAPATPATVEQPVAPAPVEPATTPATPVTPSPTAASDTTPKTPLVQ